MAPLPGLLVVGEATCGNFAMRCNDLRSGTWEELPCRPGGSSGLYADAAGAILGGHIYMAGGRCLFDGIVDRLDDFDPVALSWSSCPPMPTARACGAAAAAGRQLYVFGGIGEVDGREHELSEAERYDPASGSWEALAPLPGPPRSFWGGAAVAAAGKVYLLGGASDETVRRFDRYDPEARVWEALSPLPASWVGRAVAAAAGRLFAFGGSAPPDEPVAAAVVFDIARSRWSEIAPLPSARRSAAVAATPGGRLYVCGGAGDFQRAFAEGPVEALDARRGTWEILPSMPLYMTQGVAMALWSWG